MPKYHICVSIIFNHDMDGYCSDEGLWATLLTESENQVIEVASKMYDKMMFESSGPGYRDPRMIIGIIQDVIGEEVFVQQIYFSQDKCVSTCNLNHTAETIKVKGCYMVELTEYCDKIGFKKLLINQTQEEEEEESDEDYIYCQTPECLEYVTIGSLFCELCR
jgi:hypothetical protein